ncbi:monofunctional biosynthetic peptidoglycan transglycosylase [Hasllibacter halocynthiae]|uniref:Biosynthetic peptidoglycan transglycosylase n=1 Tax=Hasllibacter halocynthiae TaxID=595589 RepID=A0A2T0X210_9RHOB|nr:monofunctional biosynthetic peptidoglycan transglycosylase [Hasllibacter halocynthiae]PRY92993.1 monofunctional biosynthetic peptidoglycan transglycosylase [Hasllibacter halocynthiae]
MAKRRRKKGGGAGPWRRFGARWLRRVLLAAMAFAVSMVALYAVVRPPTTPYVVSEGVRLGGIERRWIPLEEMAPVLVRSVVAAEDASFCAHWGFDMDAIRAAMEDGAGRGASTISQQTVKNVYLWQGRSWLRKAIEAGLTPLVELIWPKRRILEVYLNVAEFDEGVFGAEAAARRYFGVPAADLTPEQAARLAVVLPNPKGRNASDLSERDLRRMRVVMDGAEVIRRDGRAACFEG